MKRPRTSDMWWQTAKWGRVQIKDMSRSHLENSLVVLIKHRIAGSSSVAETALVLLTPKQQKAIKTSIRHYEKNQMKIIDAMRAELEWRDENSVEALGEMPSWLK